MMLSNITRHNKNMPTKLLPVTGDVTIAPCLSTHLAIFLFMVFVFVFNLFFRFIGMQRCIISNVYKQIILPQYIPIFVIKAWYKIYVSIVFIKHFKKSVNKHIAKSLV